MYFEASKKNLFRTGDSKGIILFIEVFYFGYYSPQASTSFQTRYSHKAESQVV